MVTIDGHILQLYKQKVSLALGGRSRVNDLVISFPNPASSDVEPPESPESVGFEDSDEQWD